MFAQRTHDGVRLTLEGVEPRLLSDLLEVLAQVVSEATPKPTDDPFVWWEAQARGPSSETQRDPAIGRLFPPASSDPDADRHLGEFSRVIVAQQRLDELDLVRDDLEHRHKRGRVEIDLDHVDPWLRTLNAVNLLLTARLGILDEQSALEVAEAALDEADPRSFGFHVHQWIAGTMESILDVLTHD